jgi:hypothetical protein
VPDTIVSASRGSEALRNGSRVGAWLQKSGSIQARGLGGSVFKLPELIENERRERAQLSRLFHWPVE